MANPQIFENFVDVDVMSSGVHRSFMAKSICEDDNTANRFGVRLFKDREPVSLIGAACVCYFIRPDGVTLVINGEISENAAYVDLPQAAYVVEGTFTLSIRVSGTGYAGTVRIVDGVIVNTTTRAISDPSSEVPDIDALTAIIERAEDAADVVNGLTVSATVITGKRYKITVTKE